MKVIIATTVRMSVDVPSTEKAEGIAEWIENQISIPSPRGAEAEIVSIKSTVRRVA